MSLNLLIQDGVVKSPALRYATDGKPELRFTLDQQEGAFHLWLPCTASGTAAERLASEIEEGQHIVVTSGKLCYRKRTTKSGEVSRLEILVWSVDVLSASPGAETSPESVHDSVSEEPTFNLKPASAPESKKVRRHRWPERLSSNC